MWDATLNVYYRFKKPRRAERFEFKHVWRIIMFYKSILFNSQKQAWIFVYISCWVSHVSYCVSYRGSRQPVAWRAQFYTSNLLTKVLKLNSERSTRLEEFFKRSMSTWSLLFDDQTCKRKFSGHARFSC